VTTNTWTRPGFIPALLVALAMTLAPAASAQPDDTTRQQVWVDYRLPEYFLTHDMIAGDLDPGDGITVWIYDEGPMHVLPNTTHLIAIGYELFVYCDLNWPEQETGMRLLESTEEQFRTTDVVPRILKVIGLIHDWQQQNPR